MLLAQVKDNFRDIRGQRNHPLRIIGNIELPPYLVGYRAAADLMFSGRALTAVEAHQIGLVNAVVPADQLESWLQNQAAGLLGLSRAALALAKRALIMGYGCWTADLPQMEQLYLNELMQTADAQEGLTAFIEKRKPVWRHQ